MKKLSILFFSLLALLAPVFCDDAGARLSFQEGLADEKNGDFYSAAKKYMAAELLADDATLKMNATSKAAEAYLKADFRYKAFNCLQKLIVCYPAMIDYNDALKRQYRIGNDFYRGERDPAFYWLPWIKDEDRTIEVYEAILKNAAFAEFSPELRLRLAKKYMESGNADKVISNLREVSEYYPSSPDARYAEFELAHIYLEKAKRGDGDGAYCSKALAQIDKLIKKYPDDREIEWLKASKRSAERLASERLYGMAKFYDRRDNDGAAARYCSQILKTYPDSAAAVRSERLLSSMDQQYIPTIGEFKPPLEPEYKIEKMPVEKRVVLVAPENSNGKWLLPIEDLGIEKKDAK